MPNAGQVTGIDGVRCPQIRYVAHARGMSLYLADNRISYVFVRTDGDPCQLRQSDGHFDEAHPEPTRQLHRIDLEFIGALPSPEISAELPSSDFTNYYLANIPDGITGLRSYNRLVYRNLYPKIDFMIQANGEKLKYDFIVRPGGRVSDIRMRYRGATGSSVDTDGSLVTTTSIGSLREDAPYSYQDDLSKPRGAVEQRRVVLSSYLFADEFLSFNVSAYDSNRTLVIDPTQKWSTYFGGVGTEDLFGGDATEVDRSGNCFFTGTTNSNTFPASPGAFQTTVTADIDIVVVKMGIGGTRLWATIYGGSSTELAHGIVTDRDRNVFVAGHTISEDFPTYRAHDRTLGGIRDAFAIMFDSNGARQWATYYGGNGFDDSYGFAIDSTGNPALVGTTASDDGSMATPGSFQQSYGGGTYDVFIVKFSSAGIRLWGTYYGGDQLEQGYGAATDVHDNINITGWTSSTNFPVTAGAFQTELAGGYDAFVVRLNSSGKRQWGTYFGGSATEDDEENVGMASIATDDSGNPVITGVTGSLDLPTSPGALQSKFGGGVRDAFIAKFDGFGNRLWSTYYGGSLDDAGQGIASNRSNGVLVTGHTYSGNFPGITPDAFSSRNSGGADAFIIKLDSTGTIREYVTYYGGSDNDQGLGISFDPYGSIVLAGNTSSNDFPTTANAFQMDRRGGVDAFIALFCDMADVSITADGPTTFCQTDSVTLSAPAGYASYQWSSTNSAVRSSATSIRVGMEDVYTLQVTNGAGCIAVSDPIEIRWSARPDPVTIVASGRTSFCQGDSVTLTATGGTEGVVYWSNGEVGRSITVGREGSYAAFVVDNVSGCSSAQSTIVQVTVKPLPEVTISAAPSNRICPDGIVILDAGTFSLYRWSDSTNTTIGSSRTLSVNTPGTYFVEVENEWGCRVRSEGIQVLLDQTPAPEITLNGSLPRICTGGRLVLRAGRHARYMWRDAVGVPLGSADTFVVTRPGQYSVTVDDGACNATASIVIVPTTPFVPFCSTSGTASLCAGDSLVITAADGYATYQWMRDGFALPTESTRTLVVHTAGVYSVQVSESGGCAGVSLTTRVIVNAKPLMPEVSVVEDGFASTAAAEYQWNRNDVPIANATGRILRVPGDGMYTVTITDANGCRATSRPLRPVLLPSALVGIHEYSAAPGERISIPLMLSRSEYLDLGGARGFTARIRLNRTMLHPLGGFLSDSIDGNDRILTVAGSIPTGFTGDSSALVTIDFVALLGDAVSTPLVVESFEWDRPGVSTVRFDGSFRINGVCFDGGTRGIELTGLTRLKPLFPNPTHGVTRIEFEVEEEGRTRLVLVDIMGRSTAVIDEILKPGEHVATFDASALTSGAYSCVLRTASQQLTASLLIRK